MVIRLGFVLSENCEIRFLVTQVLMDIYILRRRRRVEEEQLEELELLSNGYNQMEIFCNRMEEPLRVKRNEMELGHFEKLKGWLGCGRGWCVLFIGRHRRLHVMI